MSEPDKDQLPQSDLTVDVLRVLRAIRDSHNPIMFFDAVALCDRVIGLKILCPSVACSRTFPPPGQEQHGHSLEAQLQQVLLLGTS